MARLARAEDHPEGTIVGPADDTLSLIAFRVAGLDAGGTLAVDEPDHEHCVVPLSGRVDVACDAVRTEADPAHAPFRVAPDGVEHDTDDGDAETDHEEPCHCRMDAIPGLQGMRDAFR